MFGKTEMVTRLIETSGKKNPKNDCGETPLHYACRLGNLDCVKILFETEEDFYLLDNNKFTPLHTAAGKVIRHKSHSSHLNFCSVKIAHRATYV